MIKLTGLFAVLVTAIFIKHSVGSSLSLTMGVFEEIMLKSSSQKQNCNNMLNCINNRMHKT